MTESTPDTTGNQVASDLSKTGAVDHAAIAQALEPEVETLERWREEQRKRLIFRYGMGVAAALVLALVIGLVLGFPSLLTFALLPSVVIVLLLVSRQQRRWRARVGAALVPAICSELGDSVDYQTGADQSLARPFVELEMIKHWNRGGLAHQVQGQRGGRRFQMAHANLRHRRGGKNSNEEQVFLGLLFRVQTALDVQPGLIVRPNAGSWAKLFDRRAVATGNQQFDQRFLVGPDDGSELDSAVINHLFPAEWQAAVLKLDESLGESALGGSRFQLALKYDSLYLMLVLDRAGPQYGKIKSSSLRPFPDVNHLIIGGRPLSERLPTLIDDVSTYQRVIDALPAMPDR